MNERGKQIYMKETGDKKIILKDWERKLLDIIDNVDKNPTLHKFPGSAKIALNPLEHVVEMPKPAETRHISVRPSPPYIITKLQGEETDETSKLGTADQQRLGLLEQLELTRMQIEPEKLLLNRLRQSLLETQGPESKILKAKVLKFTKHDMPFKLHTLYIFILPDTK
nr:unnamed protein product [Callosobruchus analis]